MPGDVKGGRYNFGAAVITLFRAPGAGLPRPACVLEGLASQGSDPDRLSTRREHLSRPAPRERERGSLGGGGAVAKTSSRPMRKRRPHGHSFGSR